MNLLGAVSEYNDSKKRFYAEYMTTQLVVAKVAVSDIVIAAKEPVTV